MIASSEIDALRNDVALLTRQVMSLTAAIGELQNKVQHDDELVTANQAAELLGISAKTIKNWHLSGVLKGKRPSGKPRGRLYFSKRDLLQVDKQKNKRTRVI